MADVRVLLSNPRPIPTVDLFTTLRVDVRLRVMVIQNDVRVRVRNIATRGQIR